MNLLIGAFTFKFLFIFIKFQKYLSIHILTTFVYLTNSFVDTITPFILIILIMRKVFGKGINFAAQINSSRKNILTYEPIEEISGVSIKNLNCGYLQTYYLLQNGQILKIGNIMDSLVNIRQLNLYRLAPSLLTSIQKFAFLGKTLSFKAGHQKLTTINMEMLANKVQAFDIQCGISRIFFKTRQNTFYGIGQNYFGQLATKNTLTLEQTFRQIQNPNQQTIKQIKCGFQHTVILTQLGNLYGCGKADSYQIQPINFQSRKSDLNVTDKILQPTPIFKGDVKYVGCGFKHTIFSTQKNQLFGLGNNKYGQCGQNSKQQSQILSPKKIYFPLKKSERILDIKCGFNHSLVLTNEDLYFFGCTQQNQNPFQKFNENIFSPTRMKLPFKAEKIFTNFDRVGVIGKGGQCVIFGGNSLSKIGGPSGELQDLSSQFSWNMDSLIGLGFGHIIICP